MFLMVEEGGVLGPKSSDLAGSGPEIAVALFCLC
jgi:hypothetical protein